MRISQTGDATCDVCQESKPASAFYRSQVGSKGVRRVCKDCTRPIARESELRRKYGITVAEYEALAARQNGRCATCGVPQELNPSRPTTRAPRRLAVDVDKATGRIRGLLCAHCRLLVGEMERQPGLVEAVRAYLLSAAAGGDPREDPRWQAANAEILAPRGPDESPTMALARRLKAAVRRYDIEVEVLGSEDARPERGLG